MAESEIRIQVDSNAAAILARLRRLPAAMLAAIAVALDAQNNLTLGYISATKLSQRGPTTLGVISNRLRSSVRVARAVILGQRVESAIGSNVRYAAAHEFGVHETVLVPAHKRRIIAFDRYRRTRGGRLVQTQSGIRGVVRAHAMRMNLPARAPFRTGIGERTEDYRAAISAGIVSAWTESPAP
jgi:phage gpG-like protein